MIHRLRSTTLVTPRRVRPSATSKDTRGCDKAGPVGCRTHRTHRNRRAGKDLIHSIFLYSLLRGDVLFLSGQVVSEDGLSPPAPYLDLPCPAVRERGSAVEGRILEM